MIKRTSRWIEQHGVIQNILIGSLVENEQDEEPVVRLHAGTIPTEQLRRALHQRLSELFSFSHTQHVLNIWTGSLLENEQREKQQKDRKLSLDEFNQLRSLVYKISWVAKECRPEASGSASILAQHLKAPTVSDVLIANRVVKFLRSSASQCLTICRHDPRNLRVISVSDAGGIGGPPTEER